jgi:antitoxin (DNA-binding transcriptional repressor) of toxin-antitoxin stability system
MTTINLEEAQARLQEVIAGLIPGEPLVITKDGEPVATLTRSEREQRPSKAGSGKTEGYWMAPDFDAPLEEFRDYME